MVEKEHKKSPKATRPAEAVEEENEAETISEEPVSIESLQEQIANLKAELEKSETKSKEYFDGWQRERADFINYKKRIERDLAQARTNAVGDVAKKFLVIMDDLERALKNMPDTEEARNWASGIELIYHKLQGILESEGITQMKVEGETFDPTRHEALTNEESPAHQSGQIIEVIQNGYLIGDKVLRHALVRVAR